MRKIPKILAILLGTITALLLIFQMSVDTETLVKYYNKKLNKKFQSVIKNPNKYDKIIKAEYDSLGNIVNWNTNKYIPLLQKSGNIEINSLIQEGLRFYYVVVNKKTSGKIIYFIPIKIHYEVKNDYLKPYLFVYEIFPFYDNFPEDFFSLTIYKECETCLNLYSEGYIISFEAKSPVIFRFELWCYIFLSFVLFLIFWGLHYFVSNKNLSLSFLIVVISIRFLLLYTNFFQEYFPLKIFSSYWLAVSKFVPSLGDLLLNNIILFLFVLYIYKDPEINGFLKNTRKKIKPYKKISSAVLLVLLIIIGSSLYFRLFNIATNSVLLTNINVLTIEFVVFLLTLFLFIVSIFIVLYLIFPIFYFGISYEQLILLGISSLTFYFLFQDITAVFFLVLFVLLGLFTFYFIHLRRKSINYFVFAFLLSLTVYLPLYKVIANNIKYDIQKAVKKIKKVREPLMEFIISEKINDIIKDRILWQDSTITIEEIYDDIKFNYLSKFANYDVYLYIKDANDLLLYPTSDSKINKHIQDKNLTKISDYLFFIKDTTRNNAIYVAKFSVNHITFRKLNFMVIFSPKISYQNRLYPMLFVDEHIKTMMKIFEKINYALYNKDSYLVKVLGNDPFPLKLVPRKYKSDEIINKYNYYEFFTKFNNNSLILHYKKYTISDKILLYIYILYLFSSLILLYSFFIWAYKKYKSGNFLKELKSFKFLFRIIFFLLGIVPIILFLLFGEPSISKFYFELQELSLQKTIKNVVAALEKNKVFIDNLSHNCLNYNDKNTLSKISDIIQEDINIFSPEGKLLLTTNLKVFRKQLLSPLINPKIKNSIPLSSPVILNEKIGKLEYLSGYYPMINSKTHKILGYVNIPYLTKLEILRTQLNEYLTKMLGIYLVFTLVILFIAYSISNSILTKLKILKNKLENTFYGNKQEPIEWHSEDEIGELIDAYNKMLRELKKSEQKIKQLERQYAWSKMARQIAHEIKNPLTPMKLTLQVLEKKYEQDKYLQKRIKSILNQINSLTQTANTFSKYSQLISGEYPKSPTEKININKLLTEIVAMYENLENITLKLILPEENIYIHGNKTEINRILVNLIKNSIEAIENQGTITIKAEIKDDKIIISVSDTGAGINENVKEKIFEPNFTTKTSGTGLGLAIVKQLVEKMNGKIYFRSQKNIGTTFFLEFPANE